jgi:DNA-directed RNA polymerase specialized sigma24 family protein
VADQAEKKRLFDQIMDQIEEDFLCMTRQYAPVGEAEDLYQEIVCAIWKSLDSFKGRSAPATCAWSIALIRACAYRKKASGATRSCATTGRRRGPGMVAGAARSRF